MKKFYITTPLYYVNDKPHIGHAYTTIACDILSRFNKLQNKNVFFLTGTDEHGQKIQRAAEKKGMDPLTFCDEISETFRNLSKTLNLSNDDFIRTTEKRHLKSVQNLWNILEKKKEINLSKYYSFSDWQIVSDKRIKKGSRIIFIIIFEIFEDELYFDFESTPIFRIYQPWTDLCGKMIFPLDFRLKRKKYENTVLGYKKGSKRFS